MSQKLNSILQQIRHKKLLVGGGLVAGYCLYSYNHNHRMRKIDGKNIYHSLLKYQDNKERNTMIHNLKTRDQHIKEIEAAQYDTLIIGKKTLIN